MVYPFPIPLLLYLWSISVSFPSSIRRSSVTGAVEGTSSDLPQPFSLHLLGAKGNRQAMCSSTTFSKEGCFQKHRCKSTDAMRLCNEIQVSGKDLHCNTVHSNIPFKRSCRILILLYLGSSSNPCIEEKLQNHVQFSLEISKPMLKFHQHQEVYSYGQVQHDSERGDSRIRYQQTLMNCLGRSIAKIELAVMNSL